MPSPIEYFASLQEDRKHGDKQADRLIVNLVQNYGRGIPEKLIDTLKEGRSIYDGELVNLEEEVRWNINEFLNVAMQLPLWANNEKMSMARRIFKIYGPEMLLGVCLDSIPYKLCTIHNKSEIQARIFQSDFIGDLQLCTSLMSEQGSFRDSKGMKRLISKRLQYALDRYDLDAVVGISGNEEVTLNQEDLLAEILSYGAGIIGFLKNAGIDLEKNEQEAIIHFWNVVGSLMGIKPTLLPTSYKAAGELTKDIFSHQAQRSKAASTGLLNLLDLLKDLLPGNRFNFLPELLMDRIANPGISEILQLRVSDKNLYGLAKRFSLSLSDIKSLNPSDPDARFLVNILSTFLIEGLKNYYHENNLSFDLPFERLEYWRSIEFTSGIPVDPEPNDNLDQEIRSVLDYLYYFRSRNHSMVYHALGLHSVLSEVNHKLLNENFHSNLKVIRLCKNLTKRNFEIFDSVIGDYDPPFAWKLVYESHLTNSHHPDQYLVSAISVNLTYNLIIECSNVLRELPNGSFRKDFNCVYKVFQNYLPLITDDLLINPSGLKFELSERLLSKLRADLDILKPAEIWKQIRSLANAKIQNRSDFMSMLESQSLELSRSLLLPAGLYNSILKSYSEFTGNHSELISQLMHNNG